MPRGRLVWGAILAIAGAVEVYGIAAPNADDTLSEFTRWAFATDTTPGRVIFGLGWLGFASWFLVHILNDGKKKP